MDTLSITSRSAGQTFSTTHQVVRVHDGTRGPQGPQGPEGPPGDDGKSIATRGPWAFGTTYCPLDAVTARSSLLAGVYSLWVQRTTAPCAVSETEPYLDTTGRWDEVGPYEWGNYFGGTWEIYQVDHQLTLVGQPVAYSFQSDNYVLSDCRRADELPIGVVREVIDNDRAVLQASGEVPNIDPTIILPEGSAWEAGRIYYVATSRGMVSLAPPTDANFYICPILMPTDIWEDGDGTAIPPNGGRNGVVLPWQPSGGPGNQVATPVGYDKFYFTATDGQTSFTGVDDRGNTLAYEAGDLTDVFQNGLNLLSEIEFTAADGATITLLSPAGAGDTIEIWTPSQPLNLLVPSTIQKLDNIEDQFDDATTDFALTVGASPVELDSATSIMVWLDGTAQEPEVDFTLVENPGAPGSGESWVSFAEAPYRQTRFWGIVYSPASDAGIGQINNLSTRDLIDVEDVDPADGAVLVWNETTGRYEPTAVGAVSQEDVDELTLRVQAIEDWACANFRGGRTPPWCS